eukprot:3516559-Amphidinium_carterae.1
MRVPLALHLAAFLHLGFYQSAARFYDRQATQKSMQRTHPQRKAGGRLRHHRDSSVYRTNKGHAMRHQMTSSIRWQSIRRKMADSNT